jgi:maleylacetoacetate isomerase/maleylpyruvate isomerase
VPTLYTYFRSSAAFRVRCALNHKGIAYAPEIVWLLTEEQKSDAYRELNPQGLVPTFVDDDGLRLNQSLAIIEYLDETKPGPKLLPGDAPGRARVRSLSQLVACEIHPINNLRILKYLKNVLGQDQPAIDAWYRHWVAEGLAALERELADPRTGRYCHGDAVTMADCCLVPQIFNAKRFDCPLDPYPATMRVFDALMALPAFDAAQPSKQPDAARAAR